MDNVVVNYDFCIINRFNHAWDLTRHCFTATMTNSLLQAKITLKFISEQQL